MGRTSWGKPGGGASLRELSILAGVFVGDGVTEEQLDKPTSLYVEPGGRIDGRDRSRVLTVLVRVVARGEDRGW